MAKETRRNFLVQAGLSAAALTLLPSCAALATKNVRYGDYSVEGFATLNHYPHIQRLTEDSADIWWFEKERGQITHKSEKVSLQRGQIINYSNNGINTRVKALPVNGTPLKIGIITDTHGILIKPNVLERLAEENPDFIIHSGDVVHNGRNASEWQTFADKAKPLSEFAIYSAIGNHCQNSPNWFNYFDLPGNEKTYTLSIDNLLFAFLDTNQYNGISLRTQFSEIGRELQAHKEKTKILVMHHPLLSTIPHRIAEAEARRDVFRPFLESHNFSLILTGHDHVYQRSVLEDSRNTNHIITSSAGGGARVPQAHPFAKFSRSGYGYAILSSNKDTLKYDAKNEFGDTIDSLTISK